MGWAEREDWDYINWVSLAQHVAARTAEPNSLQRGLDAMKEAMKPGAFDELEAQQDAARRESSQMPETSRRLVLDLYLKRSYREYFWRPQRQS